jgi:hypothetical protein
VRIAVSTWPHTFRWSHNLASHTPVTDITSACGCSYTSDFLRSFNQTVVAKENGVMVRTWAGLHFFKPAFTELLRFGAFQGRGASHQAGPPGLLPSRVGPPMREGRNWNNRRPYNPHPHGTPHFPPDQNYENPSTKFRDFPASSERYKEARVWRLKSIKPRQSCFIRLALLGVQLKF